MRDSAQRILGQRDHSCSEIRRKLQLRGFDDAELLDLVLDELIQRQWLDDERFAERFVEQRREKGFGPLRIRSDLRQRGVEKAIIDRQIDLYQDWSERLRAVAEQRFGQQVARDRRELGRQIRFLESRGFPGELIRDYFGY